MSQYFCDKVGLRLADTETGEELGIHDIKNYDNIDNIMMVTREGYTTLPERIKTPSDLEVYMAYGMKIKMTGQAPKDDGRRYRAAVIDMKTGKGKYVDDVVCNDETKKAKKEEKKRNAIYWNKLDKERITRTDERFVMVVTDKKASGDIFKDISPANLARLVTLSLYLDFNGESKTIVASTGLTAENKMRKTDMRKVLNMTNRQAFCDFIKEMVSAGYMAIKEEEKEVSKYNPETKEREIYKTMVETYELTAKAPFYRGKGRLKGGTSKGLNKIWEGYYEQVYAQVKTSQHETLGRLLQLLPYIHERFCVVCSNPTCGDPTNITPLNIKDLAGIWGISEKSAKATINRINTLTVTQTIGDRQIKTALVAEIKVNKQVKYMVNPNVIHRGTSIDYEQAMDAIFTVSTL